MFLKISWEAIVGLLLLIVGPASDL